VKFLVHPTLWLLLLSDFSTCLNSYLSVEPNHQGNSTHETITLPDLQLCVARAACGVRPCARYVAGRCTDFIKCRRSLPRHHRTQIWQAAPYLTVGLLIALALGRQITTMSLGDDIAKGLGQNTAWVKGLAAIAVVLLAGGSVAVAGPIGFIGLVIPHAVRAFTGVDYRWVLPYAAITGAIFLLIADVAGRLVLRPMEMPVGVMTALIGGPFFVYLVRWRVRR